jgi:stage III sporulation protein AA
MNRQEFVEQIVKFFPQRLRSYFDALTEEDVKRLQEVRLRVNRPLNLLFADQDLFLGKTGLQGDPMKGAMVSKEDLGQAILFLSNHSIYALDEELRQGFITIPGGHRVGFVGYGVIKEGELKQIKEFSGVNFRITRELRGCADPIMPYLLTEVGDLHHTMIISPPRCGKTTLLRDLIRQLSNGVRGFDGIKIGVVDERSELAGSFQGVPRHDLGIRTDVLDHCPKSSGMYLLIRSMSPQVIATDEIGSAHDVAAIQEAVNAGIRLITTVHGRDLQELEQRPILHELLHKRIFTRYVILSARSSPGTIEGIFDEDFTPVVISPTWKSTKERIGYG